MKQPSIKTVWIIWAVVMVLYAGMNYFMTRGELSQNAIVGWGIVMPILTNLVWWAIAFRLRIYFPKNWWVFGIATATFVGLAGFLTMLSFVQNMR